jgi:hypothetical protein
MSVFDRPSIDAALQSLGDLAASRPNRPVVSRHPLPPTYLIHLCHEGGSTSLCGDWIGKFAGRVNSSGQHEVVASTETLEYWYRQPNKFWLCWECEGHEDYPLFALGAV